MFLQHTARLVYYYVSPVGLQYDKERLITICSAKVLQKKERRKGFALCALISPNLTSERINE